MDDAMDIASTSHFRHSEDELDRITTADVFITDDDDDDDVEEEEDVDDDDDKHTDFSLDVGTMQSLSISSDGNKRMELTRMSSTSSSTSSKMPQKKVVLWEVFKWIPDVERLTKNCLGSFTEVKTTTVLNDMDFLLG